MLKNKNQHMNSIEITISIPQLWGGEQFVKSEWNDINLIVGANGTGKSLFAEQLKNQLTQKGYSTRYLNAERLSGFEKRSYDYFTNDQLKQGLNISRFNDYKRLGEQFGLSTSAFVILKERLDIKIQIEAFLSDIFNKTIRFVEEGGYLKPKMQDIQGGSEYNLKEQECHGLKELITLLTFLYDDTKECLILDEPELHLHPQFQSFFMSEIRRLAGNPKSDPTKKIFFIITHSPYFIDLRTIEDLKNVIVFKNKHVATFIHSIEGQDEYIIKKFLPRFNTHHKQFFFSENPVFVEGYTDQQLITLIYDKLGKNIGASGSSIIDVGGKDELGVFYKLCEKLRITPIIVADLDALFKGKLREVLCESSQANRYIQENGIGESLANEIGELETKLGIVADNLIDKTTDNHNVIHLITHLKSFRNENGKIDDIEHYRLSLLLGILRFKDVIENVIDDNKKPALNYIPARLQQLIIAAKQSNVYFIDIGEIEHYYTQSEINYLNIAKKDVVFHKERDFILNSDLQTIQATYTKLIDLLEEIIPCVNVTLIEHIRYILIEWIQKIQSAVVRGEIESIEHLKNNARVNYTLFNQILEVDEFQYNGASAFKCKILISNKLDSNNIVVEFDENTTAANFTL